ncbi:hypothetical protein HMPREF9374_2539 [Desmospora sp. 8437]|nr:hypothetical protein HMPREF9374_2539 [Desmospora sp. 8437]
MANFINNALTTLTTLLPFPVDYYHGVLLPRDLLIYKMARYTSEDGCFFAVSSRFTSHAFPRSFPIQQSSR